MFEFDLDSQLASKVVPHYGNLCAFITFLTVVLCYLSDSVVSFHRCSYACIHNIDLIGGPLIGERIASWPSRPWKSHEHDSGFDHFLPLLCKNLNPMT